MQRTKKKEKTEKRNNTEAVRHLSFRADGELAAPHYGNIPHPASPSGPPKTLASGSSVKAKGTETFSDALARHVAMIVVTGYLSYLAQ